MSPELAQKLPLALVFYIILVISISIHEWAHAFCADRLDDPLPRAQGRVTLNPLVHMDFWGTFIIPLVMIFMPMILGGSLFLIGWGKPVMVSLPNPKTRVRDDLLITAAGPLSNLVLAFLASALGSVLMKEGFDVGGLVQMAVILNCALFIFNLLPIPPLDGSHFLKHAVGMREETYYQFAQWGFLILLLLINIGPFRALLGAGIYGLAGFFL